MITGSKHTYTRPPSRLLRDPADLRLANGAHNPVTSVFLDDDHLTRRTFHGIAELQQFLQRRHKPAR